MELKFILESILFSAQRPLEVKELRDLLVTAAQQTEDSAVRAFRKTPLDAIDVALAELTREHEEAKRSYRLACVAGAWQFLSEPEYAPWIKALVGQKARPPRLSQPALETLAIIAYRQPITRAEIEQVRGVAVDGVMQTLLERGLVEQVGRAELPGRPQTYATTAAFLEYFGIGSLEDLPAADELRRLPVTKPEALLTVDPGLATVPPEQLMLGERPIAVPGIAEARTPSPTSPEAEGEAAQEVREEAQSPAMEGRVRTAEDTEATVDKTLASEELPQGPDSPAPRDGAVSSAPAESAPPPEAPARPPRGIRGRKRKSDSP